MKEYSYVKVQGKILKLSSLDKVLYPETGFKKREMLRYYRKIAPVMIPHLNNRPMTLKRYTENASGEYFYEKNCPSHRPNWVQTGKVEAIHYCLVNDLPTLLWATNLGSIELHPLLSRAQDPLKPDHMVFDLDPGEGCGVFECARVSLLVRDLLRGVDLESWIKTSGSKGMQLYVPLNTKVDFDRTKSFSRAVAERLEREHPDRIVSRMKKIFRPGKIFIDWSQNDDHKSTVAVYSMRAGTRPMISTPVTWKEVEAAVQSRQAARRLEFGPQDVLDRVEQSGDLFEPLLRLKQKLPAESALNRLRYAS